MNVCLQWIKAKIEVWRTSLQACAISLYIASYWSSAVYGGNWVNSPKLGCVVCFWVCLGLVAVGFRQQQKQAMCPISRQEKEKLPGENPRAIQPSQNKTERQQDLYKRYQFPDCHVGLPIPRLPCTTSTLAVTQSLATRISVYLDGHFFLECWVQSYMLGLTGRTGSQGLWPTTSTSSFAEGLITSYSTKTFLKVRSHSTFSESNKANVPHSFCLPSESLLLTKHVCLRGLHTPTHAGVNISWTACCLNHSECIKRWNNWVQLGKAESCYSGNLQNPTFCNCACQDVRIKARAKEIGSQNGWRNNSHGRRCETSNWHQRSYQNSECHCLLWVEEKCCQETSHVQGIYQSPSVSSQSSVQLENHNMSRALILTGHVSYRELIQYSSLFHFQVVGENRFVVGAGPWLATKSSPKRNNQPLFCFWHIPHFCVLNL